MSQPHKTRLDEPPETSAAPLDLGPLDKYPGYLLRRAQMAVFQQLLRILEPHQLRPTQYGVLVLLRHNPGARPSDVAAALSIQRTNFVPLIDMMQRRGLVRRVAHGQDRRARALYLTPESEKLLGEIEGPVAACEKAVAAEIGKAPMAALRDYVAGIPPLE